MDPSELNIKKLDKILNDLAEEGKYVEIRICPRCKSPNVTWTPFQLDVIGHCSQVAKYECYMYVMIIYQGDDISNE